MKVILEEQIEDKSNNVKIEISQDLKTATISGYNEKGI